MMLYAPRALRHFSRAAMESRDGGAGATHRPKPVEVRPATVQPLRPRPRTVVRLWLPTTFIFLLLASFALLLAPLAYFAPRSYGDRPLATVLGVGQLLLS
jgi:hypothetical protein